MLFEITRVLLGLIFLVFGLNGFLNWWSLPDMKPEMMKFNENMRSTQIIMPVVKLFEIIFGFLLMIKYFAFISFLALLPISFFIILAHLYFNRPQGLIMAGIFVAMNSLLIVNYWSRLLTLLG